LNCSKTWNPKGYLKKQHQTLKFSIKGHIKSLIHSLTVLLLHAHQKTWLNHTNSAILPVLLKAA